MLIFNGNLEHKHNNATNCIWSQFDVEELKKF